MQVQSEVYFRLVYGSRAMTVAHRMRTWYRQQSKKSADIDGTIRFDKLERDMTSIINLLKNGSN